MGLLAFVINLIFHAKSLVDVIRTKYDYSFKKKTNKKNPAIYPVVAIEFENSKNTKKCYGVICKIFIFTISIGK